MPQAEVLCTQNQFQADQLNNYVDVVVSNILQEPDCSALEPDYVRQLVWLNFLQHAYPVGNA